MDHAEYWRQREEAWAKEYAKIETQYEAEVLRIWQQLAKDAQAEIDGFVARYASKTGLNPSDARKYLDRTDMKYYSQKAKEYCEAAARDMRNGTYSRQAEYFSERANEEMLRYNATMRINRMEMLLSQIKLVEYAATAKTQVAMTDALTSRAQAEFKHLAGILGESVLDNADMAGDIVKASFHGATFSSRLWKNQEKVHQDLTRALSQALVLGEDPQKFRGVFMANLNNCIKASDYRIKRLLRTEFARVQTSAALTSYESQGFKEFMYITSAGCCAHCAALDGKTYKIKGSMPGTDVPPMHPNCRCAVATHMNTDGYDEWLDTFSEHGLSWEEWNDALRIDGEREKRSKRDQAYSVDWKIVNSAEYRKKFSMLFEDEIIADRVYKKSIDILKHRDGTDFEDMYLIDPETKKVVASQTKTETIPVKYESDRHQHVIYNQEMMRAIKKSKSKKLITIHNHPESYPPSGSDFSSAFRNGYGYGIIACHNGDVYGYKVGKRQFSGHHFDLAVEKNRMRFGSIDVAYKITLDDFQKEYGLTWMKL